MLKIESFTLENGEAFPRLIAHVTDWIDRTSRIPDIILVHEDIHGAMYTHAIIDISNVRQSTGNATAERHCVPVFSASIQHEFMALTALGD